MGDDRVQVRLADLDRVIGELQGFDELIEERLAALKGRINQLHVQWQGEAAAQHREAHAQWQQGAQLLADGIKRLRTASSDAHHNYRETITANRARFT